jgi:hypothetical protein
MSFNDLGLQKASSNRQPAKASSRPAGTLEVSDTLQIFQVKLIRYSKRVFLLFIFLKKNCLTIKAKVTEMRRRRVLPSEKAELDQLIRELRELESRVKQQLDRHMKQLENLPRTPELAQKRITLGKLTKDFERVKVSVQSISSEAALIKEVEIAGINGNDFNRIGESTPQQVGKEGSNQQQMTETKFQALIGDEVDEAIRLERERDIKKMNQDLVLINEMMR